WSSGVRGPMHLEASSLGGGGLKARAAWRDAGRVLGVGSFETRGGARIDYVDGRVRIACPSGTQIEVDGLARICGDGKPLDNGAPLGLALRFVDGTELRVVPGTHEAPRHVSVVESTQPEREHVLGQGIVPRQGLQRAKATQGYRYYLTGDGDEVCSLVSVGPFLLVRPVFVRGRPKQVRLLLCGDLLREGAAALERATPKRRVQYPDAEKQAQILSRLCADLFPLDRAGKKNGKVLAGVTATIAFGSEVRFDLSPYGERRSATLACGLRLGPEADRSLEWVSMPGGTRLYRVLPPWQQRNARYMGRGLAFEEVLEASLPWRAPLAHFEQREKTLAAFAPWLPLEAEARVEEAAARR
ncbi:MAG TPA: hypothetical protein PKE00_00655, partial [Planctomycetota bacterium]|nr:hypothetical protein [Planctomycetota bacterium]